MPQQDEKILQRWPVDAPTEANVFSNNKPSLDIAVKTLEAKT